MFILDVLCKYMERGLSRDKRSVPQFPHCK